MNAKAWTGLALATWVAGCAMAPAPAPVAIVKDGELAIPADYKSWKATLLYIQRPDAKQIREIYVNDIGAGTKPGDMFANGSVSVMEIYAAKAAADGTLEKGADGRLVKGNLAKVFVMGKNAGWGKDPAEQPANGDWVYSAFMPDGKTKAPDPIAACRTCHATNPAIGPSKDYFARYDEFLASLKK
ncbi:MAG: cytochrome P460 family protein [Betaproteobacteria bacterium]|nr:cytochrome P460 family protein [Betaproteobacteria bacterium]